MPEEIILSGKYKDFESTDKYILENAQKEEVLSVILNMSKNIDSKAFEFAGVDYKKIKEYTKKLATGKGLPALIKVLESVKPNQLRKDLISFSNDDKKFLPIAESLFMHTLLELMDIPFKPKFSNSKIKPAKEMQKDRIVFVANHKGWLAIKKLKIEKTTKDYEVSAILSSINFTLVNKIFELAELTNEAEVNKITKGKRKSPSNLADSLKQINEKDENKLSYLVCKTCEKLGYRPYASPHMLTTAYPDVKPPKVRGRAPK